MADNWFDCILQRGWTAWLPVRHRRDCRCGAHAPGLRRLVSHDPLSRHWSLDVVVVVSRTGGNPAGAAWSAGDGVPLWVGGHLLTHQLSLPKHVLTTQQPPTCGDRYARICARREVRPLPLPDDLRSCRTPTAPSGTETQIFPDHPRRILRNATDHLPDIRLKVRGASPEGLMVNFSRNAFALIWLLVCWCR